MKSKKEEFIQPPKRKNRRFFTVLISAEEKEYLIENLSMLLSSGMDILAALESIKGEVRSSAMKSVIDDLREDVEAGLPIWKVLEKTKFFPAFIISLTKIGEGSGGLVKNLKVISIQQKKDRLLTSKIRSAMLYPVFVLALTLIVGIGIAWFILPHLALIFTQLKIELPLITRILISFGKFISQYGIVVVPIFICSLITLFYFIFVFSKTKFIGQVMLFSFPGIKKLIQETELARMGYILGTLLDAGLSVVNALESLVEASTFYKYKELYISLKENIGEGATFQQSFDSHEKSKKLVPATIQQMIMVGEKSGHLPETMLSIGEVFEEKIDNTTKNLATIFEPVLLVIVWLGVVAVALAVILPIYSLIGGLNKPTVVSSPPPVTETVIIEQSADANLIQNINTDMNVTQDNNLVDEKKLEITETENGFLNVRDKNDIKGKIIGKVFPGEQYFFQDQQNGWYKIVLTDGTVGWINANYIKII